MIFIGYLEAESVIREVFVEQEQITVALAGNPNVGKSTIFNGLTGLKQHTGNWAGVTVAPAAGIMKEGGREFLLVDLPGTYSLEARSREEEAARDFLSNGGADVIVAVCDATCLERGLRLLKQIVAVDRVRERGIPLILCVNLCDEAGKKGISIDFKLLEDVLQFPVVPCCARSGKDLAALNQAICDSAGTSGCYDCLDFSPKQLARETVRYTRTDYRRREEFIDRIVTGRFTGGLIMILLLLGVFWLTMEGANVPSRLLWDFLFSMEPRLSAMLTWLSVPDPLIRLLTDGAYRVLAWVVSVMLPPMAIFFPLFTLLEDLGYLPRVAFNMDRAFLRCRACGKQCLTMAMGLGCNAAGVVGCRIIDSPRERLIAILTNSMVPCNGRFPTLITLITLFFLADSFSSALLLTVLILLGVAATLFCSWFLSMTLLKGVPSSFTLELPPYRRPQLGRVVVRSVFDRTLFVLGRAAAVAAPAGVLIWLLANLRPGGQSLLASVTGVLDPFARLLGLDGVILTAFILGFPANEIILPIILMAYLQTGTLVEMTDPAALFTLLTANGWTGKTALCMMLFCLFHWPCSTTCLTIRKETGSWKWTAAAAALPTALGILLCAAVNLIWTALAG